MEKQELPTVTGQQYAAAYEAHYTTKDWHLALEIYRGIMVEYPDSAEARYSRSQIENILKAVVSEKELCDAQWDLALSHTTQRL